MCEGRYDRRALAAPVTDSCRGSRILGVVVMLLCRAGTEAAQCIVWEYRRASGLLPLSRNAALLRMLNIPAVKSSCGRSPDVDGGSGRGRLERGRSNQVRSGEGQVEVRSSRTLEEPWNAFWKCAFKTTPTPVRKGAATAAVAKKKKASLDKLSVRFPPPSLVFTSISHRHLGRTGSGTATTLLQRLRQLVRLFC